MPQENKFVIIREDLVQDPVTIISDGLLIGRLLDCELLLNHPAVSRVQAGIKVVGRKLLSVCSASVQSSQAQWQGR